MSTTNPAERRRPVNFADIQNRFPVGSDVVIDNPRASGAVNARVVGVRYAGTPGTKGHSVFIDTEEPRGEKLKPKLRSARPAHCRPA